MTFSQRLRGHRVRLALPRPNWLWFWIPEPHCRYGVESIAWMAIRLFISSSTVWTRICKASRLVYGHLSVNQKASPNTASTPAVLAKHWCGHTTLWAANSGICVMCLALRSHILFWLPDDPVIGRLPSAVLIICWVTDLKRHTGANIVHDDKCYLKTWNYNNPSASSQRVQTTNRLFACGTSVACNQQSLH